LFEESGKYEIKSLCCRAKEFGFPNDFASFIWRSSTIEPKSSVTNLVAFTDIARDSLPCFLRFAMIGKIEIEGRCWEIGVVGGTDDD
jgi:hypothetical protein